MKLIGVTGLKGSGKSTVAQILQAKGYRRERLAGILKDMLRVLGLDDDQLDGNAKEIPSVILNGKTPRWAMQSLGTEWGRNCIHEDIWANALEKKIRFLWQTAPHLKFVIDDIRHENEAQMLKRLSGTLWSVYRSGQGFPTDPHPSETNILLLKTDKCIHNDGTLEELEQKVLGELK